LLKKTLAKRAQWKSRVVEESLLSDEQDSESTIFKFLRAIYLLE
jgi:hypothetical protein